MPAPAPAKPAPPLLGGLRRAYTCKRSYRRLPHLRPKPAPRVPDVEDEHVGADEEHDQPLDHVGEVAREVGRDYVRREAVRRAIQERAEEERGETGACRGVPAEEGDRDAEEADGRDGD